MEQIYSINGPVVKVKGSSKFSMLEKVSVGNKQLVGEVIGITADETTIQVYEVTTGMRPGEPIEGTGAPVSAALGPGIISNIFDGIERPLQDIAKIDGTYISEGAQVENLDTKRKWKVTVKVSAGDEVFGGQIFCTCPETGMIEHRCMIPHRMDGVVTYAVPDGDYTINDVIIKVKTADGEEHPITMVQHWPIKTPRPYKSRLPIHRPLITGQRVIDTMFPIAKGGTAAVPGGFGTGKTMTQHQLAKWCDADIIVYIGCGERGNEMTQVLEEFSGLIDPKNNRPLTDRTVLIANTSNMPVAAREASIYTGITIAEYYRDMGYHIAIMADSTSRWAEALREISGRLEEMPAEEGFPAYLPSRLAAFYERAGYVEPYGAEAGSVSIIGAVSPQGSDFSEPVTQNTKRFVRCFWALDKSLAYERHYPAINWNDSYSEYTDEFNDFYAETVDKTFSECRGRFASLLAEENKLMEIVKLIGADVLPDDQKLVIETARVIRVGFLQQNAYHKDDTYVPLEKQFRMMKAVLLLYDKAMTALSDGITFSRIAETGLFDSLVKMKYEIPNNDLGQFNSLEAQIEESIDSLYE